eukprot:4928156-Pyramimonas_sp.AAC.1
MAGIAGAICPPEVSVSARARIATAPSVFQAPQPPSRRERPLLPVFLAHLLAPVRLEPRPPPPLC